MKNTKVRHIISSIIEEAKVNPTGEFVVVAIGDGLQELNIPFDSKGGNKKDFKGRPFDETHDHYVFDNRKEASKKAKDLQQSASGGDTTFYKFVVLPIKENESGETFYA